MASKEPVDSPATNSGSQSLFNLRWERNQATALQKELLEAYEQASRAWLARMQSEVAWRSDLATKLTAPRAVPEAFETYAKCVSERMKMAADDGRLLADEAQQITQKITKSLSYGWPASST